MTILGSGELRYETTGQDWGELPDGWTYKEATAVAVDSNDNVHVFNRGGHPVIVYDSNGVFLRSWGEGVFTNPHGIAIGPDDAVYLADTGDHTVRKFSSDDTLLMTLGNKDRPAAAMSGDPFNKPTHLGVDPRNGNLYVADGYSNARVHKYSPDGGHLLSWGDSGTDPGEFNIVHNVDVDQDGWVYVADRENHRVQVFDSNGKFETQWVNLSRAACVCVDRRGEPLVYVGEYHCGISTNNTGMRMGPRVTVMDTRGNVKARLGDQTFGEDIGRFLAPHGIAVDSRGDIYVAEVSWSEFGMYREPPRVLRSLQKLVRQV